jgi:hypothetical protein
VNPAAALRPAAVVVELGDWEYEIPSLPAADWLEALLDGWTGIVPGMLHPEDQMSVMRDLAGGAVTRDELLASARSAAEAAAGRSWWEVERLWSTASNVEFWPAISGQLLARVDLERVSLGGALNVTYVIMVESMKEDRRHQFDAMLTAPPPEAVAAGWDDDAAEDDFMAALGEQAKLHGG